MSRPAPRLTGHDILMAGATPVDVLALTAQIENLQSAFEAPADAIERAGRTTYDQTGIEDFAGLAIAALGEASRDDIRSLGFALHQSIQDQARTLSYLVAYLEGHDLPDAAGFRRTYDAVFAAPDPLAPADV